MNWRGRSYDLLLNPLLRKPRQWIARQISKEGLELALDICCGTGAQSSIIAGEGVYTVGIDLDPSILKYASAQHPEVPFICGDAGSLPLRSQSFKSAVITFALHDKSPLLRKKMIDEIRRVLEPGGQLAILDFDNPWSALSRFGSLLVGGIERFSGREHFRNGRQFLAAGGLQAFLGHHGLRSVKSRTVDLASCGLVLTAFSRHVSKP